MAGSSYVGRFAPSPTGPLHFGSLLAALASYLDARAHRGKWLVRMEDIDTDRTRAGAAGQILRDLETFGLAWDDEVLYQSTRTDAYADAFERLRSADLVYPCACSRKESAGRYGGTCARGLRAGQAPRSWRVRVPANVNVTFADRFRGEYSQDVAAEVGDFIVRRADGPFAYQLAVAVDDAAQTVTDVVRGADLLDNTPRQIYLQRTLGLTTPRYAHIPVALDKHGQKLSKSMGAAALRREEPARELARALKFLGYKPSEGSVREMLDEAISEQPTQPAAIQSSLTGDFSPARIR